MDNSLGDGKKTRTLDLSQKSDGPADASSATSAKDPDRPTTVFDQPKGLPDEPAQSPTHLPLARKPKPPEHIGPYRVRDLLGEGGMGIVYLAEQKEPKRLIALKTVQPGRASEVRLKRFHHEAQILAHLRHPNIAQIYEAGNAELNGLEIAYIAMEYIEGLPLDKYVETQNLAISQRLALIAHICDAVQYAHQKGIIHRDLKPSNILVEAAPSDYKTGSSSGTFHSAVGRPKILDFGIARITTPDLDTEEQTNTGQIMGTPSYMSPEQAGGGVQMVDTRSDVYSLGVLTYKILSGGKMPYKLDQGLASLLTIQTATPTRLSHHNPDLRGDIEIIVARAMEKEMDRRYQSPGEMATDIRRYLHNEPILARRSGSWYYLRKFALRNPALAASIVGMLLLLMLGIIGTTTGMERAKAASQKAMVEAEVARVARIAADREARAANLAREEADQVSEFLVSLFTDADPFNTSVRIEELTARELIMRGAEKMRTELKDQPKTRIRVLQTMGRVYSSLTLLEDAEPLLREAVALSNEINGPGHIDTIQAERGLGRLLEHLAEYDEALAAYERAYEGSKRGLGASHEETIMSHQSIAKLYLTAGEIDRAEGLLYENLEMAEKRLGTDHRIVADTTNSLAWFYYNQNDFAKAEELFRKAAEIGKLRFRTDGDPTGEENPNMAIIFTNLSWVMIKQEKVREAEEVITRAIEIMVKTLPDEHWRKKNAQSVLASVRTRQGRFEESEALLKSSYPVVSQTTGARSPYSRVMRERFVYLYQKWNKPELAQRWERTPYPDL